MRRAFWQVGGGIRWECWDGSCGLIRRYYDSSTLASEAIGMSMLFVFVCGVFVCAMCVYKNAIDDDWTSQIST